MHTAAFIYRHINKLPLEQIFTTREFLQYGLRAAVDQTLCRLVKAGRIRRLARGVFVKHGGENPSIWRVAEAKAKAFGKTIKVHCADLAKNLGIADQANQEPTFAVNGCSSSFRYGKIRIHFRAIGARKLKLPKGRTGEALRALWHLGKDVCVPEMVRTATLKLDRVDRLQIHPAKALIPSWLAGLFVWPKAEGISLPGQSQFLYIG